MTDIVYSERAAEQIEKLENEIGNRVLKKLEEAAEWPDHFLEPLKGGLYKLRVGDYRAIIKWEKMTTDSSLRPCDTAETCTTTNSNPGDRKERGPVLRFLSLQNRVKRAVKGEDRFPVFPGSSSHTSSFPVPRSQKKFG